MTTLAAQLSLTRLPARVIPAIFAMTFGLVLFLGAGFAWPSVLHNATHDTRHSFGLPCH